MNIPFLLLLSLLPAVLSSSSSTSEGETKTARLRSLTQQAFEESQGRSAAITLDVDDYKELIIKNPRPYHTFVLVSAPTAVCDVCGPIGVSFEKAAISHYMVDDEVFFVKLDAYNHRGFQRIHGLRSVPHLIHLHEDSKLKHKKASPEFRVAKEDTYHQKVLEPTVDELLGWMNAKTGEHVDAYLTRYEKIMNSVKVLGIVTVAIICVLYGLYAARRWPIVCVVVALFIEMISTSGVFFNLLNGMVFSGKDRNGRTEYIMQGFRGQYLGEGLFCSSMMILSGMSFLGAVRAPYLMKSRKSRFVSLFLLGLSLLSGWSVWQCYKYKTGMYSSPGWFPQFTAKHGSIRNDQGFTF